MLSLIGGSRFKVLLAALMAVALLGACGGGDDDAATEPAAEDPVESSDEADDDVAEDATEGGTLEFAGTEYAFSAPPTFPAGPTKVTLVNNGDEPHMLDLVALKENAPALDKLLKMPEKKAQSFFAGPPIHIEPIKPGKTSKAVDADLQAGRYAYVCFYAEKGEKPHAFLGMVGEMTVE